MTAGAVQESGVTETQDSQGETAEGKQTGDRGGMSPRLSWGITAVLAFLVVAALVVVVLEVAVLRPHYQQARADEQARADVTRVAERFTAEANNYDVSSIDHYRASITPMLSPKFKGEFDKAMQDIVVAVKQAQLTSKGQVLTSAVASVDPDSAQVLVVADASAKSVTGTRIRHFRWQVSLVKLDGKWLIDDFTPVD